MPQIKINIQGTAAIQRRLTKVSKYTGMTELQKLADYTQSVAYTLAPKDSGEGARSIHVEPTPIGLAVVSDDEHMYVMEFGRSPGQAGPPVQAITPWAQRHGFETKQQIYLLAMSIGRRGIRARRFMSRAASAARNKIGQVTHDIAIKIEREWGS